MRVRKQILARFKKLKKKQIESAKEIRDEAELKLKQVEAMIKEMTNASNSSKGEGQKLLVDRREINGESKGEVDKQSESTEKRERKERSKTRMEAHETEKVE